AAAGAGIALDDEHAAASRGASRLRGVAGDADPTAHHVLADPCTGMAVDCDRRLLVHAAAIVADMTFDDDLDRPGEAGCNRLGAARIEDAPRALVRVRRQVM